MTTTTQLTTRSAAVRLDSADQGNRTVQAILSTESPVAVYDYRETSLIEEILLASGLETDDQLPLLVDHERSISSQVGSVGDIRRDGGDVTGSLCFATGTEVADDAWALVSQRHARAVSVGYRAEEATEIEPGQTATIAGRTFTAPTHRRLRVVSRWRLKEVSLVVIGADTAAKIRSIREGTFTTRSNESDSMIQTLPEIIGHRDLAAMTLADFCTAHLRSRNEEIPENCHDIFRAAITSVDGADALAAVVNAAVLDGFRSASDSLAGVYATQNLPNYLLSPLAALGDYPRPVIVPRGDVAPHASFSLDSKTGYRLGRFGLQFAIDSQDAEDTKSIGLLAIAHRESGSSFRRLLNDLLWSLLLLNENLSDGTPLFDASRGNYATGGGSALSESTLDAALGAIADQTAPDSAGDAVHVGLQPRFLVVPPPLFGLAKRLVRNMSTGTDDVIVRKESRLSTTGFVNPATDTIIESSGTAWMVASHESQGPALVLGALFGEVEPRVRSFELTGGGQFGVGFDMSLSVAVAAVDGRPLYWSVGQ